MGDEERRDSVPRQCEEWSLYPVPRSQALIPDPNPNGIQLVLIAELTARLRQAGIAHWLFGGWAVDFLVGEITRPHEDIDLIIWRDDAPSVREVLAPHGYVEVPPPPEESA